MDLFTLIRRKVIYAGGKTGIIYLWQMSLLRIIHSIFKMFDGLHQSLNLVHKSSFVII